VSARTGHRSLSSASHHRPPIHKLLLLLSSPD